MDQRVAADLPDPEPVASEGSTVLRRLDESLGHSGGPADRPDDIRGPAAGRLFAEGGA